MFMGKITVFTGPMASGKTERIIDIARRMMERNIPVEFYKPVTDTRDKHVKSRNGESEECYTLDVRQAHTLRERYKTGHHQTLIVIDEFQFFEDEAYIEVINELAAEGHGVVVSGLDLTSELTTFGLMPNIMCYADDVYKLKGQCGKCKAPSPSIFTYADFEKTGDVAIEGEGNKYIPVCRKCYVKHK